MKGDIKVWEYNCHQQDCDPCQQQRLGNLTAATKTMSGMGITTYTTLDMRLQVNNSHEPCPNMDAKGLKVFEEVVETQADKHYKPQ